MDVLLSSVLLPPPPPLRLEVPSLPDWNLVKDSRVIENMLKEERDISIDDYCHTGKQPDIEPSMRKIVADWMVEVCEDQQCQPEVFCLAINYLDRFLSNVSISKSSLQLAASTCLLLASKFTEVIPFTTDRLAMYTDHSVTVDQLLQWEAVVLNALSWEMSSITTHSFLEILLHSIQFHPKLNLGAVRRQVEALLTVAATEYRFLQLRPSSLVAGALLSASSLKEQALLSSPSSRDLLKSLSNCIQDCEENIVYIALLFQQFIVPEKLNQAYLPPCPTKQELNSSYFPSKQINVSYLPPYIKEEEETVSYLPSFMNQTDVNLSYLPPLVNHENIGCLPSFSEQDVMTVPCIPPFVGDEEKSISYLPQFQLCLREEANKLEFSPFCENEDLKESFIPSYNIKTETQTTYLPPFYTVSEISSNMFSTISEDTSYYIPIIV